MRAEQFLGVSCILGMALGSADCASKSLPFSSKDAATPDLVGGSGDPDVGSSAEPGPDAGGDAGSIYIWPWGEAGPPSLPGCKPPVAGSCPAVDVRYYFDPDLGRCAEKQGCEATENAYASLAECEAACISLYYCPCSARLGCDTEGLCATCPSPDLFGNVTDPVSGQACLNPGLGCQITSADGVVWTCRCQAQGDSAALWNCVALMGG